MPSDSRGERRWLIDIRHHIALAQNFTAGTTYESFKDDLLRLYAVTRCLEIISEASRRLPAGLKARHPAIEWREMGASGNVYRHEYEDLAARRVGDPVQHHLPPLRVVIEQELARLYPSAW
jgi:uncharacterized protein with HEPN domain